MHLLKDKTVYLCGSMNLKKDSGIEWREEITPKLLEYGLTVLDPCKKTVTNACEIGEDKKEFRRLILEEKWNELKERFWPVVRNDLRACDKSDLIIFNYEPEISTVGSVHELVVANYEKKVILLKYDKAQLDKFNPWICVFIKNHHFFSEWSDMFAYLREVDNGKMDTSLWVM